MELQSLFGFLAVAQLKSFSKAAKKTFRTQPAISLQIKSLEEELGVELFSRKGQKEITLTEDGKVFLKLIAPILNDINSLKSRFNDTRGNPENTELTVVTHASVMSYILPGVIKAFKKMHPEARLTILNRSRSEIVQMVKDGEADLGITSLASVPAALDYEIFYLFPRSLILPKKHPLAARKKLKVSDFKSVSFIATPRGNLTREEIERVFNTKNVPLSIAMEASDREAIKEFVRIGLGAAIMNGYYLTAADKKRLAVKDISSLFGRGERGIVTRKGRYLGTAARDLITLIKAFNHRK